MSWPGWRSWSVARTTAGLLVWVKRTGLAWGKSGGNAGHRVLFMPLDKLIATLMKAKQENRLEKQLQQLGYARVLIWMR